MREKDEYCITAGEFAKICQTTRDTLRYYERQGILVPKKNPVNGYHYYSYTQISSYYFIRTFRGLDCSVGDIREYLLGGEEIRFDEFVEQQYEKLLYMRTELVQKIGTIAGTRKILDQIRIADVGTPVIRKIEEPLSLVCTAVESAPALSFDEIEMDIREHLKQCKCSGIQAFPMGASMDKEAFMDGDYTYKNVFSITESEHMKMTGDGMVDMEEQDQWLDRQQTDTQQMRICNMKSGDYLVAVCRESDGDIKAVYEAMKSVLKREQRELISDVYSLSIVNVIDPHEEKKYLKYLFAAVSGKEKRTRG